ncbi:MAG: hypothetical protein GY847_36465 [Proteobacteria bacterium]|nr:hypothetical protein [Pseudomonadota bacterium]
MKTHRMIILVTLFWTLTASAPAQAQEPPGRAKQSEIRNGKEKRKGKGKGKGKGYRNGKIGLRGSVRRDVMHYLYPIGLIRRYSTDLKLNEQQTQKLRKVVTDIKNEVENLKWDVERESQRLLDLVKNGATKEEVYKQMDVVFRYENKIKKKHLGLMIVARDILTEKQQKLLDEIKAEHGSDHGWRHHGGGPRHEGPPMPPHSPMSEF